MDIREYVEHHDGQLRKWAPSLEQLSGKSGISIEHLYSVALGVQDGHGGTKRLSPEGAQKVHKASGKKILLSRLRPDIWATG